MTREQSVEKVAAGFRLVLEGLGLDLETAHLRDTPERAAKAWFGELCSGLTGDSPKITLFPAGIDEMVVLQDIPVRSLCAHHLLPFYGTAIVGYIPGRSQILGLSKLSRVVDYWARRLQVQEELTSNIADHLATFVHDPETKRGGVGVVVRATHMCMALRGVQHAGVMTTSALRGVFWDGVVRAEFLKVANV